MCRLLGVIANRPVDLVFSLLQGPKTLRSLAEENPDGWGLGWYEGKTPSLHKEPESAADSEALGRLAFVQHSHTFVGHVRRMTLGERTRENSHPFQHENYLFAHNGSVDRESLWTALRPDHRQAIVGETDSEVYFHWLLQHLDIEGNLEDALLSALHLVKSHRYSGLNFILTDGEKLYAFRDAYANDFHYSLYYLKRSPGAGTWSAQSKDEDAFLSSKMLSNEETVLVCSETLTDENWIEIPLGHLLTVSADLHVEMVEISIF